MRQVLHYFGASGSHQEAICGKMHTLDASRPRPWVSLGYCIAMTEKLTMTRQPQHRISLALITASFLLSTGSCWGWGMDGHLIIGEIAWHQLTDEAKAAVMQVLSTDTNEKDHRLAQATLWADDIKYQEDHADFGRYTWARHLHYVNLPPLRPVYDQARDCRALIHGQCKENPLCPPGDCVTSAILHHTALLKSAEPSAAERLIALKFLVHFVGDIHQPLHAGLKNDLGGNRINVKFFGEGKNLHSVWDDAIIKRILKTSGEGIKWEAYAANLRKSISPEDHARWLAELSPEEWTGESAKLAQQIAYQNLIKNRPVKTNDRLEKDYYQKSVPVVEEGLKKAGVRLAAILNDIYG